MFSTIMNLLICFTPHIFHTKKLRLLDLVVVIVSWASVIHSIWRSSLERISALIDSFDTLNFSELVSHSLFFFVVAFFGCKVTFLNLNCNSFSLADSYIGVYCMCFSYTNGFDPLNFEFLFPCT